MPNEPGEAYFTPVVVHYSLEPQELKSRHSLYRFCFEWQISEAQKATAGGTSIKIGKYLELCRELKPRPAGQEGSRSMLNVRA